MLVVRKKRDKVESLRLIDCSQVALFGNAQISSQALREVVSRDQVVTHLSYGGWLVAVTTPPPHLNVELRRRQYAFAENHGGRARIARAMIVGKISNAHTLLRRNGGELPEGTLRQLRALREKARATEGVESLVGIEGSAARVYFGGLATAIRGPSTDGAKAFDLDGRNRRPPLDPVNALLSFTYALLVIAAGAVGGHAPALRLPCELPSRFRVAGAAARPGVDG